MRKITIAILALLTSTAAAQAKDMAGVIDMSGKVIIPLQYKDINSVSDWLFLCEGYNSPPGAVLPRPSVALFSGIPEQEKLAFANFRGGVHKPTCRTVLFDKNGKTISTNVPEGLVIADVHLPNCYEHYEHYEHKDSKLTLPPNALITVAGKDGYGIIDGQGRVVVEPKYRNIHVASDHQIRKQSFGDKSNFGNGNIQDIDLEFQRSLSKDTPEGKAACTEHEGLVRYSEKGLFGFKDTKGKIKIPAKYFAAREFACGFAPVRLNSFDEKGRYVYIDHNGRTASEEYYRASPFVGKTAIIAAFSTNCLTYGLIDNKFAYLQEPYCHKLIRMKDGMVVPIRGMVHKVLDKDGKPIFDLPFSRILVNDGTDGLVFHAKEQGKEILEIYDATGKIVKSETKEVRKFNKSEIYHSSFVLKNGNVPLNTVQSFDGKTIMGPTDDDLYVVGNDRVIKKVHTKTFSKDDWEGPDCDREMAFENFIKNVKPVGSARSLVEKFLGKGKDEGDNLVSYDLSFDGNGSTLGVVKYKDEKVEFIDTRRVMKTKDGFVMPDPHQIRVPAISRYQLYLDPTSPQARALMLKKTTKPNAGKEKKTDKKETHRDLYLRF